MPAQAGIQYAAAAVIKPHRPGILDRPVEPGDDGGVCSTGAGLSDDGSAAVTPYDAIGALPQRKPPVTCSVSPVT